MPIVELVVGVLSGISAIILLFEKMATAYRKIVLIEERLNYLIKRVDEIEDSRMK